MPILHRANDSAADSTLAQAFRECAAPLGCDDRFVAEFAAACRDEALANAAWEAAHRREVKRVLDLLAAEGVDVLLLKGTPISLTHYEHPALRTRGDTDLLIAPDVRTRALDVLESAGYHGSNATSGDYVSYQVAMERRDAAGIQHCLDVHWRPNNAQLLAGALEREEMIADAVPIPALGPHACAPCDMHALLFACMHRAGHTNVPFYSEGHGEFGGDRWIWLFDIYLLARGLSTDQRDNFIELAVRKQLSVVAADGLRAAARAVGPFWAEDEWTRLTRRTNHKEPTARLLRPGQIGAFASNLAALPGRARLALLRETLFPDARYMRAKYADGNRTWLPALYVRRAWNGIRKAVASRN